MQLQNRPAILVLGILCVCGYLLGAADAHAQLPRTVHFARPIMGTWGTVSIVTADSNAVAEAADAAWAAIEATDRRFSNWKPDSELSRTNRALDAGPVDLSTQAAELVATALRIHAESNGSFDPTVEPLVRLWGFLGGTPRVPKSAAIEATRTRIGADRLHLEATTLHTDRDGVRIDLGGIAKGHAVDRAVAALRAHGIDDALVDVSGNMIGLGSPAGRDHWTVGVRDPDTEDQWFATLALADDAIATSGNYEQFVDVNGQRYGHVLDPRTGWPVDDLVSVTVVAPTAVEADAWATALLVLGCEDARHLLADRPDLAGVLVQSAEDGTHQVWVESSLRDRFGSVTAIRSRFPVTWFGPGHDETR